MRRALLAAAEMVVLGLGVSRVMGQVSFVSLDPPGSNPATADTAVVGISGGNVVGNFVDSSGISRGFLWNGSSYTVISDPSASGTSVIGVSGGNVIGLYTDSSGGIQSFIWNQSTYTNIAIPGAVDTFANAIEGGVVVGSGQADC